MGLVFGVRLRSGLVGVDDVDVDLGIRVGFGFVISVDVLRILEFPLFESDEAWCGWPSR